MVKLTEDDLLALRDLAHEIRAARQAGEPEGAAERMPRGKEVFENRVAMKIDDRAEVMMKPRLGEVVTYRGRTGEYVLPAIVTANVETLNRRGVIRGHVPDITGEDHVHLNVQTCGEQLAYQEHDVPFSREPIPGTWAWR